MLRTYEPMATSGGCDPYLDELEPPGISRMNEVKAFSGGRKAQVIEGEDLQRWVGLEPDDCRLAAVEANLADCLDGRTGAHSDIVVYLQHKTSLRRQALY